MATRHYLAIAEHAGPENWSISFPAFPGTTSAATSFAELMINARDALSSAVEAMHDDGTDIPASFEDPHGKMDFDLSDYENPSLAVVSVDVGGKALRINVTMDEGLVARLDSFATRAHSSRSALLAKGARMVLASELAD